MADTTVAGTKPGKRRFTVDSFFVDHRPQAVGVTDLANAKEIQLDRISADPDQPRKTFDAERLDELAASILQEGVLQPIVVRYATESDSYIIVHGERRWRACHIAGLQAVPAIVRDVAGSRVRVQQLMENIVREDLNAVDRATALRLLKAQMAEASWEQVADVVGIKRSRLFQLLGTSKLPDAIQEDIQAGRLSEKQTRVLQGLLPGHQLALRSMILDRGISSEQARRLSRMLKQSTVIDDVGLATVYLNENFRDLSAPLTENDVIVFLADAIVVATEGGRQEQTALSRTAKQSGARPFNSARMNKEVLALIRSLARTPGEELSIGTGTRTGLDALQRALTAILEPR